MRRTRPSRTPRAPPVDPDASAAAIREQIGERTGRDVGVIVSDSFGRPFRTGIVDVAIGVAGITPLVDWRGHVDAAGHELRTTVIAVADEIASAAELVMGKLDGVPAAVVRGLEVGGLGSARELVMPPERNLFPRGHHRCGDGGGTPGIRRHYVHGDAPMWRRISRWADVKKVAVVLGAVALGLSASFARPPNPKVRAFGRSPTAGQGCFVALAGCPAPAALPARPAGRPTYAMTISITAGRKVVQGTSRVSFALDRPSDRIVFRLWPNMPVQRQVGARLDVRDVRVDGAGATATEPDPTTLSSRGR